MEAAAGARQWWVRALIAMPVDRVRTAARDPVMVALALIVGLGVALRLYFLLRWRPALVGFPDTAIYVSSAHSDVFELPLRVDGYGIFLQILHGLYAHLAFVILVQHVLGIASGLLLFGAMRRAGLVRGLGLLPACVVLLGGSELFLEHAPLTEALFIFLIDLGLYAAVRAWGGSLWSAGLAGLALGVAVDVRTIGLLLMPLFVLVFFLTTHGAWLARALRSGVLVAAALAPIFAYLGAHAADGYGFSFTQNGYYDLYARVAPFADCAKFTPPKGTSPFCIHVPLKQRPGHDYWEFTTLSPVVRYYGFEPEYQHPVPGDENSKLLSFSLAAIKGQFGDYLTLVARDSLRLIDPNFSPEPRPSGIQGYGNTPDGQLAYYFNTSNDGNLIPRLAAYYPRLAQGSLHRDVSFLKDWDRSTRIDGPIMATFLALALLAPILARGVARRAAWLFGVTALVLMFGPVFASEYDWRFVIPALGPLSATTAIGGWALFERARPLLVRARRRIIAAH
jgi:hypothetical protein